MLGQVLAPFNQCIVSFSWLLGVDLIGFAFPCPLGSWHVRLAQVPPLLVTMAIGISGSSCALPLVELWLFGLKHGLSLYALRVLGSFPLYQVLELTHYSASNLRHPTSLIEAQWGVEQVIHSSSTCLHGTWLDEFVSEFTLQGVTRHIEHHLFPCMNPAYQVKVSGIIKSKCKEFQVPYSEFHMSIPFTNFVFPLEGRFERLRELGRGPYPKDL